MLVSAKEMLQKAKAGHYAVGPVSYTHLDVYKRQAISQEADFMRTFRVCFRKEYVP